jgi:hypothetical protein
MTPGRQIAAFVLLIAWCFTMGHLWIAHPGERSFEVSGLEHAHDWHGHHHDDDHHDGEREGEPAEGSHHHHGIEAATRAAVSQDLTFAAPMVALLWDGIVQALAAAADDDNELPPGITGSPPDERCSGYLYVIQTARPVRGPSLVA